MIETLIGSLVSTSPCCFSGSSFGITLHHLPTQHGLFNGKLASLDKHIFRQQPSFYHSCELSMLIIDDMAANASKPAAVFEWFTDF